MDLQKIAIEKIKKFEESGKIEKIFAERLEKTFEQVIDDCLDSWSDFGKELKEILKEELKINRKDLDLKSYNEILSNYIGSELKSKLETTGLNKLSLFLDDKVLGVTNGEIEFQELIDQFKDRYDHLTTDEYMRLEVKQDDDKWTIIKMNINDSDRDWLYTLRIKDGYIICVSKTKDKFYNSGVEEIIGEKYQFEAVLENLYLKNIRIINIEDADYMNTCYHENDY